MINIQQHIHSKINTYTLNRYLQSSVNAHGQQTRQQHFRCAQLAGCFAMGRQCCRSSKLESRCRCCVVELVAQNKLQVFSGRYIQSPLTSPSVEYSTWRSSFRPRWVLCGVGMFGRDYWGLVAYKISKMDRFCTGVRTVGLYLSRTITGSAKRVDIPMPRRLSLRKASEQFLSKCWLEINNAYESTLRSNHKLEVCQSSQVATIVKHCMPLKANKYS